MNARLAVAAPVERGVPDAPALAIDGVGLTYPTSRGPLEALRDLSFDVPAGRFVCLLGPSGCGKSSLLKLASGLLPPTSGRLVLGGKPIVSPRRDVGVVFQQPTLLPWRNVLDNVLTPFDAVGRPTEAHREAARSLLELVKLAGFERHYPHELSGGMQQRVAIARGLVHTPRLLLMDEPFAALDALTREQMMRELQGIWLHTRQSVLFITHSIPEAVFLADEVVTLSERPGRVIERLPIELPRPRTLDMMATPEFGALAQRLRRLFDI
jgi:NitT/TauT family transport system ATP-binding protein